VVSKERRKEMKAKKYDTFMEHRVNNNDSFYDKERTFLDVWNEMNGEKIPNQNTILGYLLTEEANIWKEPTKQEMKIARTIIQWLGTPVGQRFLIDVNKRIQENQK
jgi:hypothetical protein